MASHPKDQASAGPAQKSAKSETTLPAEKIEKLIEELPGQKQEEFREIIQSFFAVVERGQPRLEPETVRILTESIDKDNENKFKYLTQKQQDSHDLELQRHSSRVKMLWPILVAAIFAVSVSLLSGIYLAATGREVLGASLLTGVFGGVFGYLGGLGTAHFFKGR